MIGYFFRLKRLIKQKMIENENFLPQNFYISKKSCTFAPDLKNERWFATKKESAL